MPYTSKQVQLAHAVEHGFRPTGAAKGFSPSFAHQVISEEGEKHASKKKRRATLGDLTAMKLKDK